MLLMGLTEMMKRVALASAVVAVWCWCAAAWAQDSSVWLSIKQDYSGHVYSAVFSPDGKTLASGSYDKTVKLWDANSGRLIRTFFGHSERITSVAFSPDGKTLASGSSDNTIKLWNASSGKLIRTLSGDSIILSVVFSSDGKTLASGSEDTTIKLWNASSGLLIRTLSGHSDYVNSVAFSPDGKTLASGSSDKTIKLWDVSSGQLIRTIARRSENDYVYGYSGHVNSVAFSPDGKMLASGGLGGEIKLWNVSSSQLIRTLTGDPVNSVAFSPDGKTLASGSRGESIRLWDVSSGRIAKDYSSYAYSVVCSVAFSPDGKALVSGEGRGGMVVWSVETGEEVATYVSIEDKWITYTPDNYYVCSAGAEKYIGWKQGDKTYPYSAFSAQFNKPEIVAARLRSLGAESMTIAATLPPTNANPSAANTKPPELPKPAPKDTTLPKIVITSPQLVRGQGVRPAGSRITVTGQATDESGVREVVVNGVTARLDKQGSFSAEAPLKAGEDQITVTATDIHGNRATESFTIRRENEPPPVTGRYFALVIGNNRYPHLPSTEQLKTAINDAQEVAKLLRVDYGFEIKLLPDAKRVEIINALNEYRRSLKPDDNLLIYYAGHGHFDKETDKAYWIPTDGERSSNANWIIADDVTANIRAIPTRHILIVSDSCYSGTLARATDFKLSTSAERERYLEKMRGGKSRLLMASGGNEPVADGGGGNHSVFARALLDGLRGMEERVFTAEELFYRFIKEQVAGKSNQAPEYRYIQASGHDSGDFVFVRVK